MFGHEDDLKEGFQTEIASLKAELKDLRLRSEALAKAARDVIAYDEAPDYGESLVNWNRLKEALAAYEGR